MCDPFKAFKRALNIDVEAPVLPTTDGKPQATSQADTQSEIAKALKAQADAQAAEAAAADTASAAGADAARRRRMRLSEPGSIGSFFTAGQGSSATSAVRQLFGS